MGLFNRLFGGGQSNRKSVQPNQPEGFYAVRYEYGEAQARILFKKANEKDVIAQMTIAKCLMDSGEPPCALPWYEKAAAAGNSQALHQLTYFYEGDYLDVEADPVKAEQVRNAALKMNHPEAFLKLAGQYYTGVGVEEDKEKAFQYYLKAAELGNDEGMAEVGLCYLNGEGVKQNDDQAFAWLRRSKDGLYGYYNLAQCYLKGIGTAKNMENAVVYLEKAVNSKCMKLSEAREQLADLYCKGYGGADAAKKLKRVKEDIERNHKLFSDLANLIISEGN